jgi:hypothetical protein
MDTNMEDVGRVPTELAPVNLEPASIPTLDGWIEALMNCKQLAEVDVQRLCEKVRHLPRLPLVVAAPYMSPCTFFPRRSQYPGHGRRQSRLRVFFRISVGPRAEG